MAQEKLVTGICDIVIYVFCQDSKCLPDTALTRESKDSGTKYFDGVVISGMNFHGEWDEILWSEA